MKVVKQGHEILKYDSISMIEGAGRTCYQSQDKIGCTAKTSDPSVAPCGRMGSDYINCPVSTCKEHSSQKFVKMLRKSGHHAMIEFGDIIVKLTTNRGVTHELVRHRHCSFAQESTRYVKYDGEMEFIQPVWIKAVLNASCDGFNYPTKDHLKDVTAHDIWLFSMMKAEEDYKLLLKNGWKAQQAREILPNSLKTEIVVKANFREWRHILNLRCSKASHPQMIALMQPLLEELKIKVPVVFDDLVFN